MREEIDKALGNITILFRKDGGIELDGKDKAVVELQALITKAQSEVLEAVKEKGPKNVSTDGYSRSGGRGPVLHAINNTNYDWHTAINTIAKEKGLV